MAKRKPKEFIECVHLLLDKKEFGRNLYVTRLVSWNGGIIKLEKREFYKFGDTEEYRPSKCSGFSKDEFQLLIDNRDAILEAFDKKG
jgi:hypothetical protein